MSEWPMVKLGEYCDVIMGQAPKGIDVNQDLMGLPLIAGAGDFSSTGVEVSKWTEKPTKTCIINDIILSVRATVGTYRFADRDYCLGRGVAALRAKDNLDQKYLSFVIDFYRTKLLSAARGATFLQISKADIETLMIPLPPLGEQKRIAEILGGAAEAEQHAQDTLELLNEVVKSSFYTFCGIPDHFERRKKLGEIAIVATGNTPPRKDPSNYGSYIEWIKSDNLEAYSAAGKTWFGWWLVEHYLPYHVNRPNSCDSGEPARGRKYPPYFQMGYGSFDHIPDLVDTLVESPLPLQQGFAWSSLERCIAP